jgi:LAO/AO transport system kinase
MGTDPLGDTDTPALAAAICGGDRSALARAITVVESTRADHRQQAQQLLMELLKFICHCQV